MERIARPEGTRPNGFNYNSAGQVTNKKTPDGGNTNYWYNSKGQLKLTQKARQEEQTDSMYSYVKYDDLGRVTESGRVTDIAKDSAGRITRKRDTKQSQIWENACIK